MFMPLDFLSIFSFTGLAGYFFKDNVLNISLGPHSISMSNNIVSSYDSIQVSATAKFSCSQTGFKIFFIA